MLGPTPVILHGLAWSETVQAPQRCPGGLVRQSPAPWTETQPWLVTPAREASR